MKQFFLRLFLFSSLAGLLNFGWILMAPVVRHIPFVWPMLLFFVLATGIFHILSVNASKGRPQVFIRFYMGSTALRLFLYALIIVAYRFYDKSTLIPFALGFMAHYFLFTIFEVPLLLKELKKS